MGKRCTQEEVLSRFFESHGTKYDYSKFVYVKMLEKVCIICPDHGQFWMTPADHINNHGCTTCGGIEANRKRIEKEKSIVDENGESLFEKRYKKIHTIRRNKDNYHDARMKQFETMKEVGTYDQYRENWHKSMVENGRFIDPEKIKGFKEFKRRVHWETRKTLKVYGNMIGYYPEIYKKENKVIDHKYSIKEGFINQISISILSHLCNIELLDFTINAQKGTKCSCTIDQLMEEISNFHHSNSAIFLSSYFLT